MINDEKQHPDQKTFAPLPIRPPPEQSSPRTPEKSKKRVSRLSSTQTKLLISIALVALAGISLVAYLQYSLDCAKQFAEWKKLQEARAQKEMDGWDAQFDEERWAQTENKMEERAAKAKKEREELDERFREMDERQGAFYKQIEDDYQAWKARMAQPTSKSPEEYWRMGLDKLQAEVIEFRRPECKIATDAFEHLADVEFIASPALTPTCWLHAKAMLGRGEEGGFNQMTFTHEGCSYAKRLFRKESLSVHPDKGGTIDAMERLKTAQDTLCAFSENPLS